MTPEETLMRVMADPSERAEEAEEVGRSALSVAGVGDGGVAVAEEAL